MKQITTAAFTRQVPLETLRTASILGAISSDAIAFMLEEGTLLMLEKGETLFNFGDKGSSFFIVAQGTIDFYKHHQGKRAQTRSAAFGNELGFVSMIALHDRTGEAVAYENSLLIEISCDVFARLHEEYPFDFGIITLNLARDMARTLRKLGNDLVEVSSRL